MADLQINPIEVKNRIVRMIDELNMNSGSFAEKAGISKSVLSNIVNEKSNVSLDTINRILVAFPEWNKNWLLFGEGNPHFNTDSMSTTVSVSSNTLFAEQNQTENNNLKDVSTSGIEVILEAIKASENAIKEISQPIGEKNIAEIRVFYTDGSYEVFKRS